MHSDNMLSVIIVYYEKYFYDDPKTLYNEYKKGLENTGLDYEIIYIIDGALATVYEDLLELNEKEEKIKIIKLGRWFGDATALEIGFNNSNGKYILTLPSYYQVEVNDYKKLIDSLETNDMAIGWRFPRLDSVLNNLQSKIFNSIIKFFLGTQFHDLKCNVRAFKREVLETIYMYGDQDRFLPLWAWRYGFKVKEVKVTQHKKDIRQTFYPLQNYIQRFLELVSMFFLVKFTKKPIRFFGSSGLIIFALGLILAIYLFIQRAFMGIALADRPILLVSILLIVFGVLAFSIGLIGELIIFTHAKDIKDYIIEDVIMSKSEIEDMKKEVQKEQSQKIDSKISKIIN